MIKWVLQRAIDRFERDWKYDGSYMRDIIDASPRAACHIADMNGRLSGGAGSASTASHIPKRIFV